MAVATMGPPTEAEIRAAIERRRDHPTDDGARRQEWVEYLSDGLREGLWFRARDHRGDLLDEDPELAGILDEAEERIRRVCMAVAIEEFTAAGLEWAARHPDYPRHTPREAGR